MKQREALNGSVRRLRFPFLSFPLHTAAERSRNGRVSCEAMRALDASRPSCVGAESCKSTLSVCSPHRMLRGYASWDLLFSLQHWNGGAQWEFTWIDGKMIPWMLNCVFFFFVIQSHARLPSSKSCFQKHFSKNWFQTFCRHCELWFSGKLVLQVCWLDKEWLNVT